MKAKSAKQHMQSCLVFLWLLHVNTLTGIVFV